MEFSDLARLNGAFLVHKPQGISSFGVIERLEKALRAKTGARRKDLPKMGHGGTLDPFATGLLVVCVGNGVKLSRYLLGSKKTYSGTLWFGQTTASGDPTNPITETSPNLPESQVQLQRMADEWCTAPYPQIPPMHSAKKKDGKPLYELARQGIEIEREAKICQLSDFKILALDFAKAPFEITCTSGTYIRVVAHDFGRKVGSVAMLETLHRLGSGKFRIENACTLEQFEAADESWDQLPSYVSFDEMLDGYPSAVATAEEKLGLIQGKQQTLIPILTRVGLFPTSAENFRSTSAGASVEPAAEIDDHEICVMIYESRKLIAVARRTSGPHSATGPSAGWQIERVFT
ncbi:MAG: tRNA pseudouridine(55) synthase TruB [Methylotenera sp.]|nr:tRNA pseudouridine(55) synthase TruB [Oligoflexia bacterium]